MARDKTILIRKGFGAPADGELLDGEPAIDITPTALRLFAGVGGTTDLLALPMTGGTLRGYLTLNAEPIDPFHAATRSYVDRGVFPEAPSDSFAYGRLNAGWDRVLRLSGGDMTGGIGFSNAVADTPDDLSRHLDLWGGQYGVNVSSGRLGVLSGMELALMCGGADILTLDTGTINAQRPLYLMRDPLFGNEAATRAYVNSFGGNFLPLSGGVAAWLGITGSPAAYGQGAYLVWNKNFGDGSTWLLNNRGGGPGGFTFGEVDDTGLVSARLSIDGAGTITSHGRHFLAFEPVFVNEATTKAYVDALTAGGPFLPLSGGSLFGGLSFGADTVADPMDMSRHLSLFDNYGGMTVTGGSINIVSQGVIATVIGGTDITVVHPGGLQLGQGSVQLVTDAVFPLEAVPLQQLQAAIAANPGPPGPAGPPGADSTVPGPAGPPGQDGAQGVQGEQGIPGNDGAQGIQGVPGNDGAQGIQGEQGIPGNDGAQGPQGVPGNDGAQGIQGDQGIPGIQGDQGIQGIQGDPGQSAVIVGSFGVTQSIATLPPNGFIPADWDAPGSPPNNYQMLQGQALVYSPANEADPAWGHLVSFVGQIVVVEGWVDVGNIRGPQGIQGIQGQQGIQGEVGPQGIQGNDGQQGIQGNPGNDGAQGPQGVPGNDGAQGVQGDQGIPGNDGAQGPQGVPGNDGAQGIQGEKGDQGDQGVPGVGFPDADADGFTYGRLNQAGWDRVLSLAGGTLNGGLSFGGAVAPGDNPTDLSNHITLHTAGYGFSVTGGRLNVVAGPGASIQLNVAGADRVLVSDTAMVVALPFQVVGAGIQYNGSGFANHVMGFGWDGGRIVGLVDGGPQGQLAYVSDIPGPPDLSGYLPTSGGTMNGFLIMNTAGISYPGVALGTASVIGFGASAGRIHAGIDGAYSGDLAYTSDIPGPPDLSGYLPLSGGRMTGTLETNGGISFGGSNLVGFTWDGRILATIDNAVQVGHLAYITDLPDLTDLNNRVASLEGRMASAEAIIAAYGPRIRLLEQAVREVQFKAWIDPTPAYIIPP